MGRFRKTILLFLVVTLLGAKAGGGGFHYLLQSSLPDSPAAFYGNIEERERIVRDARGVGLFSSYSRNGFKLIAIHINDFCESVISGGCDFIGR